MDTHWHIWECQVSEGIQSGVSQGSCSFDWGFLPPPWLSCVHVWMTLAEGQLTCHTSRVPAPRGQCCTSSRREPGGGPCSGGLPGGRGWEQWNHVDFEALWEAERHGWWVGMWLCGWGPTKLFTLPSSSFLGIPFPLLNVQIPILYLF